MRRENTHQITKVFCSNTECGWVSPNPTQDVQTFECPNCEEWLEVERDESLVSTANPNQCLTPETFRQLSKVVPNGGFAKDLWALAKYFERNPELLAKL